MTTIRTTTMPLATRKPAAGMGAALQSTGGGSSPWWAPYLFIAPFIIIFLVFTAYPIIYSVWLSMQQTFGPRTRTFIGLSNYQFLLRDPLFLKAMWNTTVFAAASVFIQLPLALGLAMLLNRPKMKGRAVYRLIFFSPSLVGIVFVAMMFSLIFERRTGLLNIALARLTIGAWDVDFPWLQEYVMLAMVLAALWMYVGFNMIYFLAALQNVSPDLVDAARVDGAGPWHRFIHVTLPAIRPVGTFVVLLSLIGSFQLFELPWVLLGGAGPDNQGLTVVMYLFQTGFVANELGYASSIGWVMAVILGAFAIGQRIVGRVDES
jgi:ABC-type sugar transport system permease subunit